LGIVADIKKLRLLYIGERHMAIPIKYSYSGADCRAVAFYSSVDDYAYNQPKEGDAFFTFTTTELSGNAHSQNEEVVVSSAFAYKILYANEATRPKTVSSSTNNPFDYGLLGGVDSTYGYEENWPGSYSEGRKIRAQLKEQYDVRYGNASPIINLDSLATISYSIYEAKSPVRRLGERGVSGYTRSIRTIAGSMVFLVIEDHPLSELIKLQRKSKNWSVDKNNKAHSFRAVSQKKGGAYTNFVSTLLEPFNIGLFYKTEVGFNYDVPQKATKSPKSTTVKEAPEKTKALQKPGYIRTSADGAHLVISGIDIISEGMVTSVNDMVTEVTMQFVAQDVFNIEKVNYAQTFTRATSDN
jgi:hypothetical protein